MRFAWLLLAVVAAAASATVPRHAPEFRIVEPSGRSATLSGYRGNVVLLAFVLTTCPHCQALSTDLEKLQGELGGRGFRATEVAFDENADVDGYRKRLGITFPVGRGDRRDVLAFLGIAGNVRIGTPQVVLIDRSGMIRAQSAPEGSPALQSRSVLAGLIESLLGKP